jgi:hypothetical protein
VAFLFEWLLSLERGFAKPKSHDHDADEDEEEDEEDEEWDGSPG